MNYLKLEITEKFLAKKETSNNLSKQASINNFDTNQQNSHQAKTKSELKDEFNKNYLAKQQQWKQRGYTDGKFKELKKKGKKKTKMFLNQIKRGRGLLNNLSMNTLLEMRKLIKI